MTTIEWTHPPGYAGMSWNPVTGCTKVSPGCAHCYAEAIAHRFNRNGGSYLPGKAKIICHPERLEIPLRRKKPTCFFGNSMSDLFHEDVPNSFILSILRVAAHAPRHIFQFLTKRAERMADFFDEYREIICEDHLHVLPVPNVWLGVSVENQVFADRRIPLLLQTPAAVRFLSVEPLLKPVDLGSWMEARSGIDPNETLDPTEAKRILSLSGVALLDWVIVGGESGPKARAMEESWPQRIINDCRLANVPAFMKQMGSVWAKEHGLRGKAGDISIFPEDLRVRDWPKSLMLGAKVH